VVLLVGLNAPERIIRDCDMKSSSDFPTAIKSLCGERPRIISYLVISFTSARGKEIDDYGNDGNIQKGD
jgi:hypothetical protein